MFTRRLVFSKLLLWATVLAVLGGSAERGVAQANATHASQNASTSPASPVVPNFRGASDREIIAIRNQVEEQQDAVRGTLLSQLKNTHLSPLARTETISLLGNCFPDNEIILALINNMNHVATRRPDDDGWMGGRFIGYIARHELALIGAPAEMKIFSIIATQRPGKAEFEANPELRASSFDPSYVEGFAGVLTEIEGKPGVLSKLREGAWHARDPAIKAHFQAVIAAVERGQKSPIRY